MIKSILAVAVAGAFSATAFAAMPSVDNGFGSADVTKIDNNFTTLDNSKLDKSTYNNNVLFVNSKLAEKVDTTTFDTKLGEKVSQTDFDNLNNRLFAEGTGILPNLEAADAQLNQKIDATASTLQGNIDTNKANIQTNANNIATNKANIQTNANDIATNKANIQTNANNIATNKANIQTNANNIATNANSIAANRTLIEQYKASSDAQFKAVNSRIDSLDDKMKKGFASQAALNGLFQPYNVGKFNVSAAIGGYDSEQAMALGTGYRFNDNFAIKAGVASDLSGFDHVTYNIGANFEF